MLIIDSKMKKYYDCQMSGKYVGLMECTEVQAKDETQSNIDCDAQVIDAILIGPDLICDTDGIVISTRWKQQERKRCKTLPARIYDWYSDKVY